MNTIAFAPQQPEVAGGNPRVSQPAAKPAAPAAKAATPARADQVQVRGDINPYEGFSDDYASVTVDRWRKGPNDSIEHILRNQGYSSNEIYKKDRNGQSLIQRVAAANGLKDPNLIRPGQKGLKVPVKAKPAEQPKPEAPKPVVEQPKPEPAKPVAEPQQPVVEPKKDEPQQPQQPGAETPQPAPAKPKKHHRFLWFGRKDKPETPVQPQQPEQPQQPQQPKADAPQPGVQPQPPAAANDEGTDPASIAAKEGAEVNLLMKGVTDGKFTRNEFMALNATANQYTELRSQYAKDGFKPEQVVELSQVQQQYGQMYARFLADDKAKVTFAGADSQDPAARFRSQQNEEGGQLYDQFIGQQIDEATIRARLLAQRQASGQR
ncbi:hypothetical protein JST97_24450 [bacterium]|nr:hypothetical protein [bacterium]